MNWPLAMEGIVPDRLCRVPMGGPTPSEEWMGLAENGGGGEQEGREGKLRLVCKILKKRLLNKNFKKYLNQKGKYKE